MTVAVLGELSSLLHLPGASTPTVRFHCFKIALILLFCYICYFCCFRKVFLEGHKWRWLCFILLYLLQPLVLLSSLLVVSNMDKMCFRFYCYLYQWLLMEFQSNIITDIVVIWMLLFEHLFCCCSWKSCWFTQV